jgi:parvulin-like peptidyl-prolyl isomerase
MIRSFSALCKSIHVLAVSGLLVATLSLTLQCSKKSSDLASFDGGSVTTEEYINRFITSSQYKPEVVPTEENLREIVANLAMEKIVVLEARKQGMDRDADFMTEVRERENLLIYQAYMRNEIINRVISDSLIQIFYKNFSPQYQMSYILRVLPPSFTPKQVQAQQDTIQLVYKLLQQGTSFPDLAKKFSQDAMSGPKGGDQGFVIGESLGDAALRETLARLATKSYSAPFKGVAGWYILYKGDKRDVSVPPLAEVRERIWSTLYRTRRHDIERIAGQYFEQLQAVYHFKNDSTQINLIQAKVCAHADELADSNEKLYSVFSEQELASALSTFDGGQVKVLDLLIDRRKRPLDQYEFGKRLNLLGQQRLFALQARNAKYDQRQDIRDEMATITQSILRFAFYQKEIKAQVAAQMETIQREQNTSMSPADYKQFLQKKSSELEKDLRSQLEIRLKAQYKFDVNTNQFSAALAGAAEKKNSLKVPAKTAAKP